MLAPVLARSIMVFTNKTASSCRIAEAFSEPDQTSKRNLFMKKSR